MYDVGDLSHHGHQESMIALIHQSLEILGLLIEFLLDVVLHLMGDETTCNLICNLTDESEVIRCKILIGLLVGYFKYTYCMTTQFDWY